MTETQKKTLGLAIASLIFGCFALIPFLGLLFTLPAIILGIIALVKISGNKDALKGNGLAISGIVMGAMGIIIIPIVALLAAIAIPNLLRARLNANECAAIASLRTISTACESYRAGHTPVTYPDSLPKLSKENPPYIDAELGTGVRQGYEFSYTFVAPDKYACTAKPITQDVTGRRVFYVDETGVVRIGSANGPRMDME